MLVAMNTIKPLSLEGEACLLSANFKLYTLEVDFMLRGVKVEDIPSRYEDMIDAVGIEGFLGLVQLYGGSIVYLPTVSSIVKNSRDRKIREEFKGNYDTLAIKYNMSRSQIYNIINR